MTSRIAIGPAQQELQWTPRRTPYRHTYEGAIPEILRS